LKHYRNILQNLEKISFLETLQGYQGLQNLEKISILETLQEYTSEPGENIYLRNITGIYFRTWRKYLS